MDAPPASLASPLPPAAPPGRPSPTQPEDRLHHLDVLRGFALLGVLLSNIQYWFRAPRGHQNLSVPSWPGPADQVATWLLRALVETKFIFLFSLLFGVGLAMLAERAPGRAGRRVAVRRLMALMGIGALHVLLLWNGEILLPYGALGLLALPFVRCSHRTLWRWVSGLWLLLLVLMLLEPLRRALGPAPAPPVPAALRASDEGEAAFIAWLARHYLDPSWVEVTRFRLQDYGRVLRGSAPGFLAIFTNLLTGLALWRGGLLREPGVHRPALRRFVRWGLPLGLLLHAAYASKAPLAAWARSLPWSSGRLVAPLVELSMLGGALLLSLAFGAAVLLLAATPRWRALLAPLAGLGRTALSAYLLQSLGMTAVFYGWGLGQYNRMGPLHGALLGLAFFGAQLLAAGWWLRRFRFGPVEWAWRWVTYGTAPPLRRG